MAKKTVEQEYKLLSQEEQILLRPDTMIGTVEPQVEDIWAFNGDKIEKQNLTYIPAFIKLFDEILTNASDHAQRGKGVSTIKVNIDNDWNISVWNDGEGIPIQKHKEHDMYIPEMVLGKLNSGSNYDDKEERYGAGRNGVGSGCVALFSSKFIIDCADGKKSYYQELFNNAFDKSEPIIKASKQSYTSITYTTDFNRIPIKNLEDDTLKIIKKRIYDVAVYNPKIKVYFNDELVNIKSIKDWIAKHTEEEVYYEDVNDKWAVGITKSENGFEHCSIVNGNTTWQGGTHVNYIMNNIVNMLTTKLTKGKKYLKIRPSDIKNKIHLFLVCKVANPAFDTQTKVNLKTRITDNFDLSVKFYNDVLKSEIVESILDWIALKEQAQLKKVNNKSAGKTLRIPKLVDAHKAGTVNGYKATLCVAEGDSALTSVLAGFSEIDRNYWGVFPVKGRPLNVRDVPASKIADNDEISNIMKIIGLVPGKKYKDVKELRYGKILFFTDSDPHGISIKGLLINMFHKLWPELLELGFCYEFITPIVKATKGKNVIEYYDLDKYKREKETKLQGYKIKYYKGLGTFISQ
jgi:DNA topoisomerase II